MVKATYERVRRLPGVGKLAERLAQNFSQDYVQSVRQQLDTVSPTMCAAKWLQSTIHLERGETHSCHHPPRHKIPLSEIRNHHQALHNTEHKKRERRKMLKGERPEECSYCWSAEDAGSLSDRHYKSAEDWARPLIAQLGDQDVNPTYVEVSFSSSCQMSCSYCDPNISSAIRAEIKKHGPYSTTQPFGVVQDVFETGEYTEAFWKWWPELRSKLKVLRLTGGEPLLVEENFQLLESLVASPQPHMNVSLNSNLMISEERFQRFQKITKDLIRHGSVKEFHLYASIDTWGEQAEWLRHGLDVKVFGHRLESILRDTPQIPVTILVTFNALSVFRFKELLDYVLWCRQTYPKATLKVGVSLLSYPSFLALPVLPKTYAGWLDDITSHYMANDMKARGSAGFSPSEIDRFKRVVDQWKTQDTNTAALKDLKYFTQEHDRRKGTDFNKAFPDFWKGLAILIFVMNSAMAQDFGSMFRPGASNKNFSFEESFYAPAKVNGSDHELQQRQWRVRAGAPAWNNGKQEVTFALEAGDLVLHHPSPALAPYRTVQGTLGWRYYGQADKVRGVTMSYGSASDRPFARPSNDTQSANYLHQFNGRWWGAVNYSNNRSFANGIPIPGFFYVSKMTREETLLLGLPFVFWRKRYASGLDFQATSFIPWNHQAQVGYFWGPFTGVTLGFEHRPQQFFRNDRDRTRDRFFYLEQKLTMALQGAIIPRVLQWRVEAGHAFNRSFFEARNFSESRRFDIPIGDANFVGAQVTSSF